MEIFIININNTEKVSEETLKHYQKKDISVEEKRKIHCLSYLLVDKFLEEVYGIESREVVFDNGKPMLVDGGKYFSISHSGDLIAIVFSYVSLVNKSLLLSCLSAFIEATPLLIANTCVFAIGVFAAIVSPSDTNNSV